MNCEEIKKLGDIIGLSSGEAHAIKLVKEMDGEDGPIHQLQIVKKWDDPKPDEPKRAIGAKRYVLFDAGGFVSTVKKYGDPEKSLVVHDDNYIVALLDATQTENYDRVYDAARMKISHHTIYARWHNFYHQKQSHEAFLEFIKMNMVDIMDGHKLVESYNGVETTIGLKRVTKLDKGIKQSFAYESLTGGSTEHGELIVEFEIVIPVLESDDEFTKFTFHVDILEPRRPDDEAQFKLRSREFELALPQAVKDSVSLIKDDLDDFTIVYGDTTVYWEN